MSSEGFSPQHTMDSPTSDIRHRRSNGTPPRMTMSGAFPDGSERGRSPSSTIFGSSVSSTRLAEPSPVLTPWGMNSLRKGIIKADPAMTTTFDRSDAELYALWAPAR